MMVDLQAAADQVEIEAPRGGFVGAVMTHNYDRLASLFTEDGAVRMPRKKAEPVDRGEIRGAAQRLQDLWHYLDSTPPGGAPPAAGQIPKSRHEAFHERVANSSAGLT